MSSETLPDEYLYAEDGHASDVALTCLADGQGDVVPEALKNHVLACPTCHAHLGNAALLSLRSDTEVRAHLREKHAAATRVDSPYVALALGLALAVLGALPRLVSLPSDVIGGAHTFVDSAPTLVRAAAHAASALGNPEHGRLAASVAAAAILLAIATLVARRETRAQKG
ncbi:MAG: hypothetical protein U0183_19265 [Polyangiaceae bacterium]